MSTVSDLTLSCLEARSTRKRVRLSMSRIGVSGLEDHLKCVGCSRMTAEGGNFNAKEEAGRREDGRTGGRCWRSWRWTHNKREYCTVSGRRAVRTYPRPCVHTQRGCCVCRTLFSVLTECCLARADNFKALVFHTRAPHRHRTLVCAMRRRHSSRRNLPGYQALRWTSGLPWRQEARRCCPSETSQHPPNAA